MTLYRMFDASTPPGSPYPGSAAVAGYVGGSTPHVWTLAEWQRFAELRQFPIWVGAGRTDGSADGAAAVEAVRNLGWAPNMPNRRFIVLDMETEVDPGYINDFAAPVNDGGFWTLIYESLVAVDGNPVRGGIWLADWDGIASIPAVAGVIGVQYKPDVPYDGTQVDLSVISLDMLVHGGEGSRR